MSKFKRFSTFAFLFGIVVIALYWLALRPPSHDRIGYAEDLGGIEVTRQIIADNLRDHWRPTFFTERMFAPTGINATYCSWSLERDGIGGLLLLICPSFPWMWFYFGLSLWIAYAAVGVLLKRMKVPGAAAWFVALGVVLFNTPRHFKTYHHYEHITPHWTYIILFYDAWIWQRFAREKRFSWVSELWRLVLVLCTFGVGGYYWGALLLEWIIVRLCLAGYAVYWKVKGRPVTVEPAFKKVGWLALLKAARAPLLVGTFLFCLDLWWFLPLARSARELGTVPQSDWWNAPINLVIRPLWLEPVFAFFTPFFPDSFGWLHWILEKNKVFPVGAPETCVTIGWFFWIPVVYGVSLIRKKKGGPGFSAIAPIFLFLLTAVIYLAMGWPYTFQGIIQSVIPFMNFFRVVSRMGLFLCPTAGALIGLCWPELSTYVIKRWREPQSGKRRRFYAYAAIFAFTSLLEFHTLAEPVQMGPAMEPKLEALLSEIKKQPGTTALNLPFCVAGGNGVCTDQQCPFYPRSVTPSFLTEWHDKKVYGFYMSRLVASQCQIYNQPPYTGWFKAWFENRCFNDSDWGEFCTYLEGHQELSAVLLFPGIWTASAAPECRQKFESMLGPSLGQADLFTGFGFNGEGREPTSMLWYAPHCRK